MENWVGKERAVQDQIGQDTLVSRDRAGPSATTGVVHAPTGCKCANDYLLFELLRSCRTQLRHRDSAEPPYTADQDNSCLRPMPPRMSRRRLGDQALPVSAHSAGKWSLVVRSLTRTSKRWLSWSSRLGATGWPLGRNGPDASSGQVPEGEFD